MPRMVNPYHSQGGSVYHIYSDCRIGMEIKRSDRRKGTDKRKLCKLCRGMMKRKK